MDCSSPGVLEHEVVITITDGRSLIEEHSPEPFFGSKCSRHEFHLPVSRRPLEAWH